jgi:hypothetical protein
MKMDGRKRQLKIEKSPKRKNEYPKGAAIVQGLTSMRPPSRPRISSKNDSETLPSGDAANGEDPLSFASMYILSIATRVRVTMG